MILWRPYGMRISFDGRQSVSQFRTGVRQTNVPDGTDCSYGVCTLCLPVATPTNPDAISCATWTQDQSTGVTIRASTTPSPTPATPTRR